MVRAPELGGLARSFEKEPAQHQGSEQLGRQEQCTDEGAVVDAQRQQLCPRVHGEEQAPRARAEARVVDHVHDVWDLLPHRGGHRLHAAGHGLPQRRGHEAARAPGAGHGRGQAQHAQRGPGLAADHAEARLRGEGRAALADLLAHQGAEHEVPEVLRADVLPARHLVGRAVGRDRDGHAVDEGPREAEAAPALAPRLRPGRGLLVLAGLRARTW
mmetsp:Transcript_6833/g.21318  ORF Transcript_6833/g.21318 Transcript_6833/m.21318 type:complete len:215 (+) Transcript_6833:813-1457(+)